MISDEQVQEALDVLLATNEEIGETAGEVRAAEHMLKHQEALLAKSLNEGTIDARKWYARTHRDWLLAADTDVDATTRYRICLARRETAEKVIAVWQSYIKAQTGPRP